MLELVTQSICQNYGSVFVACHDDWWGAITADHLMLVGSTLLGGIVGALASGWIQYRMSTAQRRSEEKATALGIISKTFTITNQTYSILSRMLESLEDAERAGGGHLDLWQRMVPIAGLPVHPERITSHEMALIYAIGKPDLASVLFLISEKFASFIESLHTYNSRRQSLSDALPAEMSGIIGAITMDRETYRSVAPRMVELEDLATQLTQAAIEDMTYFIEQIAEIGRLLKGHFSDRYFPLPTFPPETSRRITRLGELASKSRAPAGPHLIHFDEFQTSGSWTAS